MHRFLSPQSEMAFMFDVNPFEKQLAVEKVAFLNLGITVSCLPCWVFLCVFVFTF